MPAPVTLPPSQLPSQSARKPVPPEVRRQLLLQRQRQAAENQANAQAYGQQRALAQQRLAPPAPNPITQPGAPTAMTQLVSQIMAQPVAPPKPPPVKGPPTGNTGAPVAGGKGYLQGTTLPLPKWYEPGLTTWKGATLNPAAMAAYQKASQIFGRAIPVTDTYRSYQSQVDAYHNKPDLAAPPGHSYHQLGLAIDVSGLTPQMAAALRAAGFQQLPSESWHWTYRLTG